MLVIGASASAVCKRMLAFHRTPLCGGSRTVKIEGMSLAGVGGCISESIIVKAIVMLVARARTGSRRGRRERHVVQ